MNALKEMSRDYMGLTAKDGLTGFKGVITASISYLTGCDQYSLQPPVDKDGDAREPKWFDGPRLEIDQDEERVVLQKATEEARPGGPTPDNPPPTPR